MKIIPTITLHLDFNDYNCCSITKGKSSFSKKSPCQNSVPKWAPLDFFTQYPTDSLNATTITIGCKWIGKKSADDQVRLIRNAIKRRFANEKHNNPKFDGKYCYVFEYQANGQIHAHGIEYGTYRVWFDNTFKSFGIRNTHAEAFKPVKSALKYIEYMKKDQNDIEYEMVTNVTKKDIRNKERSSSLAAP